MNIDGCFKQCRIFFVVFFSFHYRYPLHLFTIRPSGINHNPSIIESEEKIPVAGSIHSVSLFGSTVSSFLFLSVWQVGFFILSLLLILLASALKH